MGTLMITTNQTLNLATYGLKAGDPITVIAVGGGAGGSAGDWYGDTYYYTGGNGGAAGCPGLGSNGSGAGGAGGGYGAGGGGGGSCSYGKGGNGGGAGAYNITTHVLNATTVNSIAVTIGAGGAGGYGVRTDRGTYYDYSSVSGFNGGITSFGTILSANGGICDRGGFGEYSAGGGGGGQGGYLFPQKIYGGSGGKGGRENLPYTAINNGGVWVGGPTERPILKGAGGGGGSGYYSTNQYIDVESEQYSEFGGRGGKPGAAGGYGVESHGSGCVVVMW